jgi:hypothetical protein
MKFTRGANANMTSYKGEIHSTLGELVDIFGPPDSGIDADLDKVTCEWRLRFEDGTVATIYDWKTNRTPRGEYGWHIGGYDERALELVEATVTLHRDRLVKLLRDYERSRGAV